MLSSIGLGNIPLLSQLTQASGLASASNGPPDRSGTETVSGGSASGGVSSSGAQPSRDALAGVATGHAQPSTQSAASVAGMQSVAPVSASQSSQSRAYAARGEGGADTGRSQTVATQRADFRAQLIDRIGTAPTTQDLTVAPKPGVDAPNMFTTTQSARDSELQLDHSY